MRLIISLVFFFVSIACWAQTATLTTTFKFINIEEGYDHMCKTQVWVDGALAGESPEVLESKGSSFKVEVPYGEHQVRIINLALYEGVWEEHTIENDYSIDCSWEGSQTFGKKGASAYLLFDIDDVTQVSWKKMPKPAKY
jgi:hypothetical protein